MSWPRKPPDVFLDPFRSRQEREQRVISDARAALLTVYTQEEALAWLNAPHRLLGGRTPYQVIRDGDIGRVYTVIDQLLSGAYV